MLSYDKAVLDSSGEFESRGTGRLDSTESSKQEWSDRLFAIGEREEEEEAEEEDEEREEHAPEKEKRVSIIVVAF